MLKSQWLSELQKYETNDILVKSPKFHSLATILATDCISASNWDKNLGHPRIKWHTCRQCEVSFGLETKQTLHGTSYCSCLEHCFLFYCLELWGTVCLSGPSKQPCGVVRSRLMVQWKDLPVEVHDLGTSTTDAQPNFQSYCVATGPSESNEWSQQWWQSDEETDHGLWLPSTTCVQYSVWNSCSSPHRKHPFCCHVVFQGHVISLWFP